MAHPGTLHRYCDRLVAFEHSPPQDTSSSTTSTPTHILLWVGGLTDGLVTVQYPTIIAKSLPSSWRIVEVLLSSSYEGWGTGSLARDARELGQCVDYFRSLAGNDGGKVVIMGHSTGCQDVMELCIGSGKGSVKIDGAILQGGVSDREGFTDYAEKTGVKDQFDAMVEKASKLVQQGRESEVLQKEENALRGILDSPMTAYRTLSLLSKGGDDDYFSSDLSDDSLKSTFGKFPKETPLCILIGELDPYMPSSVNREELIKKWTGIVRQAGGVVDDLNGGVVKGAGHNLNGDPEEAVQDLVKRVVGFLKGVE